jgi:hypothetical protein
MLTATGRGGLVVGRRLSAWVEADEVPGLAGARTAAIACIIAASNAASVKEAPVRHSPYPSPLPRLSATMVLTYGTGGATAALTVVGLCMFRDDGAAGNS